MAQWKRGWLIISRTEDRNLPMRDLSYFFQWCGPPRREVTMDIFFLFRPLAVCIYSSDLWLLSTFDMIPMAIVLNEKFSTRCMNVLYSYVRAKPYTNIRHVIVARKLFSIHTIYTKRATLLAEEASMEWETHGFETFPLVVPSPASSWS